MSCDFAALFLLLAMPAWGAPVCRITACSKQAFTNCLVWGGGGGEPLSWHHPQGTRDPPATSPQHFPGWGPGDSEMGPPYLRHRYNHNRSSQRRKRWVGSSRAPRPRQQGSTSRALHPPPPPPRPHGRGLGGCLAAGDCTVRRRLINN